ncbi:flagellar biosynthesis protein FlhF [Desulfocucumis palustris]|uniref:Flagellar biosynthesis protein FlhF n=1 Tax=Desulfocucumis palustris TaxID=1898651 RepID=A0A2L2XAI3_9FIRM|nr:hypothetical protein [Desulfocucumis palustris]GBF33205.1 flagellar biosynthesis protein FlhF [Desulfocucumis palustris]
MKIKKYVVRDMQEAIKLIREDLGPDAVIVSNYPLPRRGLAGLFAPRQIEVTAALDEPVKQEVRAIAKGESADSSGQKLLDLLSTFNTTESGISAKGRQDKEGNSEEDSDKISPAFSLMLKKEGKITVNNELFSKWRRILSGIEIQDSIVNDLLQSVPEVCKESDHGIKSFLAESMTKLLEPFYINPADKKVNVLVGPAGAGKTLTLVKMAAMRTMRDNKQAALITLNGDKVGSLVELKYYGNLIQTPVDSATDTGELAEALDRHRDKDYIFIDTSGVAPNNSGGLLKIKDILESVETEMDIYLVMNSTTRLRDLKRCAGGYNKLGYNRFIFTRLDETETLGPLLNLVCNLERPVSYVSFGQKVPDDMVAVTPKKLAGLVLGGVDRYAESGAVAST